MLEVKTALAIIRADPSVCEMRELINKELTVSGHGGRSAISVLLMVRTVTPCRVP